MTTNLISGALGRKDLVHIIHNPLPYRYYVCLLHHTTDVTMASVRTTGTMMRIPMVKVIVSSGMSLGFM